MRIKQTMLSVLSNYNDGGSST